jgi:hypothetical protein
VPVSPNLCADAVDTFAEETELRLEADGLLVPVKALGLKFHGYLDFNGFPPFAVGGTGRYGFILNEWLVEASQTLHELVVLSAAYNSADTNKLVAPESAAKHIDVHMGQFDVLRVSIGAASREVARAFGWILLLQSLAQAQARSYVLGSTALEREGMGHEGETHVYTGAPGEADFVGVAVEVSWVFSQGRRVQSSRLVDYTDPVSGTIITNAKLPPPSDPELRRSDELRRRALKST